MKKIYTSTTLALLVLLSSSIGFAQTSVTPTKSLFLNGTSQYMQVPSSPVLDVADGQRKTITFWFKTTGITSTPRLLAKRANANGTGQSTGGTSGTGYELWMNSSNNLAAGNANGATGPGTSDFQTFSSQGYNATPALNDGIWHHAALVFDNATAGAKTVTYYIDAGTPNFRNNGTAGQQLQGAGTYDFSTGVDLIVGASCNVLPGGGAAKYYFSGAIDDIRVYDKAMAQSELASERTTAATASTPNLISAWDFENVSGTTVYNIISSAPNGALVGGAALPIKLSQFSGTIDATRQVANLVWKVAGEINVQEYKVESSTDGKSFGKAGTITASGINNYSFAASLPLGASDVYYRLNVIDKDATSTYSNVLHFKPNTKQSLSLYPNPAHNQLVINAGTATKGNLQIVEATTGRTIQSFPVTAAVFTINITTVQPGAYIAQLVTEYGTETIRFVKK
jgi:hypothetical protein